MPHGEPVWLVRGDLLIEAGNEAQAKEAVGVLFGELARGVVVDYRVDLVKLREALPDSYQPGDIGKLLLAEPPEPERQPPAIPRTWIEADWNGTRVLLRAATIVRLRRINEPVQGPPYIEMLTADGNKYRAADSESAEWLWSEFSQGRG